MKRSIILAALLFIVSSVGAFAQRCETSLYYKGYPIGKVVVSGDNVLVSLETYMAAAFKIYRVETVQAAGNSAVDVYVQGGSPIGEKIGSMIVIDVDVIPQIMLAEQEAERKAAEAQRKEQEAEAQRKREYAEWLQTDEGKAYTAQQEEERKRRETEDALERARQALQQEAEHHSYIVKSKIGGVVCLVGAAACIAGGMYMLNVDDANTQGFGIFLLPGAIPLTISGINLLRRR